jgi:Family of unknown function (DUF6058)
VAAIVDDDARLPESAAEEDLAYVREWFVPVAGESVALVEAGLLPKATYALPDGTAMVPADHAQLLIDVGGDAGRIEGHFRERFLAAGGMPELADEEYEAWLGGGYGACLRTTSPESIVVKSGLMNAIEALLSVPRPDDVAWGEALRGSVDALDAIERPFARWDRERFGAPTSRERLVDGPRARFPELWSR